MFNCVRRNETAKRRIVVTSETVLKTCFGIVVISTVADGVELGDCGVFENCASAPCVVGVVSNKLSVVNNADNVSQGVFYVLVVGVVVTET